MNNSLQNHFFGVPESQVSVGVNRIELSGVVMAEAVRCS
ncbi:MAG: hypothetical protein OJF51_001753 [Nitrospira sp.]|nr:MAG: hypothetical protein OJF51_001753 [Nitrospira sp.]